MTKFIDPEETRKEIAEVLIKALGRGLTDDEVSTINCLGDCEMKSRLNNFD